MSTNMYRVGDYVYFETSSTSPYQIRRIEELNKTSTGNVEAKVMCFYRRRELPHPLVQLADKHQMATTDESPVAMKLKKMWLKTPVNEEQASQTILDPSIAALDEDRSTNTSNIGSNATSNNNNNNGTTSSTDSAAATAAAANASAGAGAAIGSTNATTGNGSAGSPAADAGRPDPLSPKQRNQMKHRELFLSRQVETLPATHIRGKCSVTLLNETESLLSYLNKDDTFFYCLVYDPTQKTLLADKGEIRVGSRYQTDVQPLLREGEVDASRTGLGAVSLETLLWTPQTDEEDRKIDQYLVVSRSVGTFARALDCSSSVKQPSLHMSAAAASRDITLFHAMDTLHGHNYSIEAAMCSLVPYSGPVLCRDEMEEWSASEANLFEEALDKYGKDFNDIRQDFLPWKSLKNIVEYYYMWKTTDRYVQQKRVKAVEAESKLKQVYIPNYAKPGAATAGGSNAPASASKSGAVALNGNSGAQVNGGSSAAATANSNDVITVNGGKPCESCAETSSPHWYAWGPTYLCQTCWTYWKKYGGLKVASVRIAADGELELLHSANSANSNSSGSKKKGAMYNSVSSSSSSLLPSSSASPAAAAEPMCVDLDGSIGSVGGGDAANRASHKCSMVNCGKEFKVKTHLARHYAQAHGIAIRSGSPRPIMKTRTAFYLHTTGATKLSRRLCRSIIRSKKAARQPSFAINTAAVKQEFATLMVGKQLTDIAHLLVCPKRERGSVTRIANRLGNPGPSGPTQDWLILTPKERMPKPVIVSFPKPPKAADGSLLYERIPNKILLNVDAHALLAVGDESALSKGALAGASASAVANPQFNSSASALGNSIGGHSSAALAGAGNGGSATAVTPMDVTQAGISSESALGSIGAASSVVNPAAGGGVGTGGAASTSFNVDLTKLSASSTSSSSTTSAALKRRIYDDSVNGVDRSAAGPPAKRPNKDPMPSHRHTPEQYAAIMAAAAAAGQPVPRHHMNGKPKIAQLSRSGSGRKQVISWTDAPDDVFFRISEITRKNRRALTVIELRRAARKPWRPLAAASKLAAAMFPPPAPPPPASASAAATTTTTAMPPAPAPATAPSAAAAAAAAMSPATATIAAAAAAAAAAGLGLSPDALPASMSAALVAAAAAAAAASGGASSSAAAAAAHQHQQQQHFQHLQQQQHHHHHQSLHKAIPSSSSSSSPSPSSSSSTLAMQSPALAGAFPLSTGSSPPAAAVAASSGGNGAAAASSNASDMQVVILD